MLKAGVHVWLRANRHDSVEVMNVNMNENPEQPRQNFLAERLERAWEAANGKYFYQILIADRLIDVLRNIGRDREDFVVVDLTFDPVDEVFNVLWRRKCRWLLELVSVRPEILVPRAATHFRARGLGAVLRHSSIDQIYAVEEVHNVNRQPVVHIFARRKSNHILQVDPRLQAGLRLLV